MRKIIPYDPSLKEYVRKLSDNSTLGEIILWKRLKGKQLSGFDFHRQKPIDRYIVDFFCHELMLAIEIDGSSHESEEARTKDAIRQSELEKMGITFLRFSEDDVRHDVESVIQSIRHRIGLQTMHTQ